MSFHRRMILVGSDLRFGQQIQTHLHKTFLLTCPLARYDDVAFTVRRDTDGVLLFLASEEHDADRIEACVREIRLQQLPPRIAVLATESFPASRRIESLASQLDANFIWPGHMKEFNTWAKRVVVQGTPFPDIQTETTQDRIRNRLLSYTPSLESLAEQLQIAANHDVTVLIEGEAGTGKTFLAKLLHDSSLRAQQRFVVVTCGAVPPAQFNHELFGQSGNAETSKLGKVAAAGSGTLLLDEIDTLSPEHQSHILRMVETGEYEPVGTHETQHCKARIVASTNGSLAEAVGRGAFRSDLYYRLQVLSFRLPPLRERPQDIPCLVRGMVARFSTKFGKRVAAIHAEAMRALELYPWPGNIRQLENVLQQAVLSSPGEELRLQHLPPIVQIDVNSFRGEVLPKAASGSLAHNRETSERATILRALEKASFSRTRAAKSLGVSRVTLYKKMKKYGLLGKTVGMAQSPLPVPATTSIV